MTARVGGCWLEHTTANGSRILNAVSTPDPTLQVPSRSGKRSLCARHCHAYSHVHPHALQVAQSVHKYTRAPCTHALAVSS